ncbi:uncharacterized protein LOC142229342 [Haematobia irritans]|uniref:uncharacterized protein LOC142229342 n=1 Tax=Haematobia irritans TaxID=7368 RepID=UPI003F5079DD
MSYSIKKNNFCLHNQKNFFVKNMTKFSDYFNSTTYKGRANVAKATYASFALLYMYNRFRNRRRKSNENVMENTSTAPPNHLNQNSNESIPKHDHTNYAEEKSSTCGCPKKYKQNDTEYNSHHHDAPISNTCRASLKQHTDTISKNDTEIHADNDRSVAAAAAVIHSSSNACESSDIIDDGSITNSKPENVSYFPLELYGSTNISFTLLLNSFTDF